MHYKAKKCDEESWLLSQQTSDSHEMCARVVPVWPVLGTHRTSLGSQLSSRRVLVTTNGECHSLQQTVKRLCFSIYLGVFGFAAIISVCFTFRSTPTIQDVIILTICNQIIKQMLVWLFLRSLNFETI